MLDHLDPNEPRAPKPREAEIERPLTDREVPLTARTGTATLHAWLDGELPENAMRMGVAPRDVDFWVRLDRDLQVKREMTTPAHVYEQIMAALPSLTPMGTVAVWYRKPMAVSPMVAMAAAAGAMVVGVLLGAMLFAR